MIAYLEKLEKILEPYPWSYTIVIAFALLLTALLANWLVKLLLVDGMRKLLKNRAFGGNEERETRFHLIPRLANIVPLLVLSGGVKFIPGMPETLSALISKICNSGIIIVLALAFAALLDLINSVYQRRPDANSKPIKGYLQVLKILITVVAVIMIISTLLNRSPMFLLSGLGALAAVLMLIFQDTILSLVASVQIGSNDMVRVGDWIEMPSQNADGYVIDIALHTIKVQNWDKTITTLPIRKLITDSFKNWRGMTEAGGRRIKRSIYLDQKSIRFLNENDISHLKEFVLLDDYLEQKKLELAEWNKKLIESGAKPINCRRVTNLGTFRAYIGQYLRNHPRIHQDMIIMVRQLHPAANGIPLEIYCFTNDIRWDIYEGIQADIFDHLLAIIPEFGLRVFQQCSDSSGFIVPPAVTLENAPLRGGDS